MAVSCSLLSILGGLLYAKSVGKLSIEEMKKFCISRKHGCVVIGGMYSLVQGFRVEHSQHWLQMCIQMPTGAADLVFAAVEAFRERTRAEDRAAALSDDYFRDFMTSPQTGSLRLPPAAAANMLAFKVRPRPTAPTPTERGGGGGPPKSAAPVVRPRAADSRSNGKGTQKNGTFGRGDDGNRGSGVGGDGAGGGGGGEPPGGGGPSRDDCDDTPITKGKKVKQKGKRTVPSSSDEEGEDEGHQALSDVGFLTPARGASSGLQSRVSDIVKRRPEAAASSNTTRARGGSASAAPRARAVSARAGLAAAPSKADAFAAERKILGTDVSAAIAKAKAKKKQKLKETEKNVESEAAAAAAAATAAAAAAAAAAPEDALGDHTPAPSAVAAPPTNTATDTQGQAPAADVTTAALAGTAAAAVAAATTAAAAVGFVAGGATGWTIMNLSSTRHRALDEQLPAVDPRLEPETNEVRLKRYRVELEKLCKNQEFTRVGFGAEEVSLLGEIDLLEQRIDADDRLLRSATSIVGDLARVQINADGDCCFSAMSFNLENATGKYACPLVLRSTVYSMLTSVPLDNMHYTSCQITAGKIERTGKYEEIDEYVMMCIAKHLNLITNVFKEPLREGGEYSNSQYTPGQSAETLGLALPPEVPDGEVSLAMRSSVPPCHFDAIVPVGQEREMSGNRDLPAAAGAAAAGAAALDEAVSFFGRCYC